MLTEFPCGLLQYFQISENTKLRPQVGVCQWNRLTVMQIDLWSDQGRLFLCVQINNKTTPLLKS